MIKEPAPRQGTLLVTHSVVLVAALMIMLVPAFASAQVNCYALSGEAAQRCFAGQADEMARQRESERARADAQVQQEQQRRGLEQHALDFYRASQECAASTGVQVIAKPMLKVDILGTAQQRFGCMAGRGHVLD